MEAVNIDRMLDPQRKGFLKPGIMLSGKEYMEVCRRGLKSHRGNSLALIETSPDPLSAKVLIPQAPTELRDGLRQAEQRYNEAEKVRAKSFERLEVALDERAKFSAQTLGSSLTELGVQRLQAITAKINEAEADFRSAESCESEARIEKLHAEQVLQNWVRSEGDRRQEAIKQAAEAEKSKPAPLSERLSRLKKKVTG